MLALAAISLASATLTGEPQGVPKPATSVRATALATVRLVEGEIVRFAEDGAVPDSRQYLTRIRLADGEHEAKIVEFQ
jgi:hypothetical protein